MFLLWLWYMMTWIAAVVMTRLCWRGRGGPLTGPVAEAPDVDLRRTTRSRHQTQPGAALGWGQEAAFCFCGN